MAEELSSGVLFDMTGKLLKCLEDVVVEGMPWGSEINNELDKLNRSLSAVSSMLFQAEERRRTGGGRLVDDWLRQMKLALYDMEDLLQELSAETLKRQVMGKKNNKVNIFVSSSNHVIFRLKMGPRVKLVRKRLESIASLGHDFNFTVLSKEEVMRVRMRRSISREGGSVPSNIIVGREEEQKRIIQYLFEEESEEKNVSVISIVGFSGMGKTTLAELVYSTKQVKEHFDFMAWVSLPGDIWDARLICERIFLSGTLMNCEGLQMNQLKDKLKLLTGGRKYLIVLDDVWIDDPEVWLELQESLLGCAKGSKILVTTQIQSMTKNMASNRIHYLEELSHEMSWTLFAHFAFRRGGGFPESSSILSIAEEVLETCAGFPLLIKTIGCMLSLKKTEVDWSEFQRNDLPLIKREGYCDVQSALKLSYDSLSTPLKRCFGYCALFPRNYEINKQKLIQLWMAQGFLELQDRTSDMEAIESMEDVGERYFKELLTMSFFQASETDETGDIFCFEIHDFLRFLVRKAEGHDVFTEGYSYLTETTRHAWVSHYSLTRLYRATKLRTLVVTSPVNMDELTSTEIFCKSKHMRVLDLSKSKITSVPYFVGGLSCLSYLDLSGKMFHLLPESICSLYKLQTLILTNCKNLTGLPKGTRNLVSLRHLDMTGCDNLSRMPRGLGELTCLQTLSDFVLGAESKTCGQLTELKTLLNLRGTVKIRNISARRVEKHEKGTRHYPDLLTQHKFIDYLWLEWNSEGRVIAEEELLLLESLQPHPNIKKLYLKDYRGMRFPTWMDTVDFGISFPNIVYIGITSCTSCENLPPFGLLPSLEHLFLWDMPHLKYIYDEQDQWSSSANTSNLPSSSRGRQLFPSLKKLDLFRMPRLVGLGKRRRTREVVEVELEETPQHFHVLEELYICSCPSFIPYGSEEGKPLQNISSLRSVYIYNSVSSGSLLPGLQGLPNLQSLTLDHCENMMNFPDWIANLTSLREIHLQYCQSLESIPEYFRRLALLKRLLIRGCPKLRKRCEKERGDDWPNISHILYVSL